MRLLIRLFQHGHLRVTGRNGRIATHPGEKHERGPLHRQRGGDRIARARRAAETDVQNGKIKAGALAQDT